MCDCASTVCMHLFKRFFVCLPIQIRAPYSHRAIQSTLVMRQIIAGLILLLACGAVVVVRGHLLADAWAHFQAAHNKRYATLAESAMRRNIFTDHLLYITAHNLANDIGLSTFRVGLNHLSDRLTAEVIAERNGVLSQRTAANASLRAAPRLGASAAASATASSMAHLPAAWNWTHTGAVTRVRDQGACGSCWSFAAAGALEGAHFRKTGRLVELSNQHLIDCARGESTFGCGGGRMEDAFEYVQRSGGLATESSYPYAEREGGCRFGGAAGEAGGTAATTAEVGATAAGYAYLPQSECHELIG